MPVKALMMAPSGEGKTCALASLLLAGYTVNVIDTDNGIPALTDILRGKPEALSRLSYITLTEQMKTLAGMIFPARASVWPNTVNILGDFKAPTGSITNIPDGKSLGAIAKWDDKTFLVLDTLSTLGEAAKNFHLQLNTALAKTRTQNEFRRDVGAAQGYIDKLIQLLYDTSIGCNVILNTHMVWAKEDGTQVQDNEKDVILCGYPAVIGKSISIDAQGKGISKYFNNLFSMRGGRIWTRDLPNVKLKSSAPTKVKSNYVRETGWADLIKDLTQ